MTEFRRKPSPPLPPDPSRQPLPNFQPLPDKIITSTPLPAPSQPPAHSQPRQRQQDELYSQSPSSARSRATSLRSPAVISQPTPIKDAVSDAFEHTPTTTQLDPDFLKKVTEQVTEQVIKSLHAANIMTPATNGYGASSLPAQQTPWTPTSTDSFASQSIPSSPRRSEARYQSSSHDSRSPERNPLESGASLSDQGDHTSRSRSSTQGSKDGNSAAWRGDTESVRQTRAATSRIRQEDNEPPRARRRESTSEISSGRPPQTDGHRSEAHNLDGSASRSRAREPSLGDLDEPTTLETYWQPLFLNGSPLPRLSQFLRGLAKHLTDDYEPKGSFVVTPAKMLRFFDETKVAEEHYPWSTIFGGEMSNASIGALYRKLLCQHHLVQNKPHETPGVPALTPVGFDSFMTCLIQAHPSTEFERLRTAVMNMPISNADDSKERFPKDLSRRLLPAHANVHAEQRLISSLDHEPVLVPLARRAAAMPPPPASAPPRQNSTSESDARSAYAQNGQWSNAIDDDDLSPPCVQIERERKPYFGRNEGNGKKYDADAERERDRERGPSRPATSRYRPEPQQNTASATTSRPARTNSAMNQQTLHSNSGPIDSSGIPPSNPRHRMSTGQAFPPPPPLNNSGGRRRSPPRTFARSEPQDVGNIPSSQYASNLPGAASSQYRAPPEFEDDNSRYYGSRRPSERNVNKTEDDGGGRGYPIPQRNGPSSGGYDNGYNQGGPSVGSYGSRSGPGNAMPPQSDRRTWYGPSSAAAAPGMPMDMYSSSYSSGASYTSQALQPPTQQQQQQQQQQQPPYTSSSNMQH